MFFTSEELRRGGRMKERRSNRTRERVLLYYKTKEDIETYQKKPVKLKLQWLQAQMEFFHKAMPAKAKKIREKFEKGEF